MFSYSIERLALGTYRNLVTCNISSNLVDVLKVMDRTHFASIPIVDEHGRLVDVFYKSMITVRTVIPVHSEKVPSLSNSQPLSSGSLISRYLVAYTSLCNISLTQSEGFVTV
jgi:predicted transcriptional regulator